MRGERRLQSGLLVRNHRDLGGWGHRWRRQRGRRKHGWSERGRFRYDGLGRAAARRFRRRGRLLLRRNRGNQWFLPDGRGLRDGRHLHRRSGGSRGNGAHHRRQLGNRRNGIGWNWRNRVRRNRRNGASYRMRRSRLRVRRIAGELPQRLRLYDDLRARAVRGRLRLRPRLLLSAHRRRYRHGRRPERAVLR
jgi:hypothetical protein